jgi:hypothetical protein
MADAPDRSPEAPAGAAGVETPPATLPAPVSPGEYPGLDEPEAGAGYRPLSLLAVAGFVLAAGYAVLVSMGGIVIFAQKRPIPLLVATVLVPLAAIVVALSRKVRTSEQLASWGGFALTGLYVLVALFGLVSYSGTNPWVLPLWTILIPLGTAAMCWVARSRILASEGTLAGTDLANWGMLLSLFFGLNYSAYLISNRIALSQQANEFTQSWLTQICEHNLPAAFAQTIAADKRPQPTRDAIERQYNNPGGPSEQSGPFGMFQRNPVTRELMAGKADTKFSLSTSSPTYEATTVDVKLQYHVTTPYSTFDLIVPTRGSETLSATGGRGWQIEGYQIQMLNRKPTALGQEVDEAQALAAPKVSEFLKGMSPIGKRADAQALTKFTKDEFSSGALVKARPNEFWVADKAVGKEIEAIIKRAFRPEGDWGSTLNWSPEHAAPTWEDKGDRFAFQYPVTIQISEPNIGTKFLVEAEVVIESPRTAGQPIAGPWTVTGLNLLRGGTPPKPRPGPGGRPG